MKKFDFSFCGDWGWVECTLAYQGSEKVFMWGMTRASRELLVIDGGLSVENIIIK